MSSPDWQELERLWQSSSEAAQAKDLIIRMHRRPWLRRLTIASEILLVLAGIAVAIFVMLRDRPNALLSGVALLVLSLCAGGITLWARLAPRASAEQSVTAAIDTAIHRVQVRARLALATLWMIGITMFFFALTAFLWAQADEYTTRKVHAQLHAFVIWCAWSGLWQVFTIPYYLRRVRELQRLQDIRQGLKDTL
jgi:Ca2+/Na+ antiporter